MKIQYQVCTIEQGETLFNLGVNAKSSCYWVNGHEVWSMEQVGETWPDEGLAIPAFNVAELGVMLPSGFDSMYLESEKGWRGYNDDSQDYPTLNCLFPTEAICRAEMLIKYIGNMRLRVEKVNEKLAA